jgi:disulfide bond formation protein DsbB
MKTTILIVAVATFIIVSFVSGVFHSPEPVVLSSNISTEINTTHERYIYDVARDMVVKYKEEHTYMRGKYDCDDMSFDLWNQLITKGLTAKIMAGNPSADYKTAGLTHAWVVVEVAADQWIALESTGGFVSTDKSYMHGVMFDTPADVELWTAAGGRDGVTTNFGTGESMIFRGTEVVLTPYISKLGM